ncbi:MAG: hypothetical protein RIK87_12905 [Fuerstiella sp.]
MHTEGLSHAEAEKGVPGRLIVVAMFSLGIIATGILWTYWQLHLMPFMPLQKSLAAEFDESSPRVDGGRRKSHKGTPMILRVVMRVPFDPIADDPETQQKVQERLTRTRELAEEHADLDSYELLEVHLYKESKEQELQQKTFLQDLSDPSVTPSQ